MAEVSAALVKDLRTKTGAGMMDCKKALAENNGDLEAAIDWLRKKGLSQAAKKAGRVAAEGLVGVAVSGTAGAVVEINSETDFVARNDKFQDFVRNVADIAVGGDGTVEGLGAAAYPATGKSVGDSLTDLIATIGENMTLRRVRRLSVGQGVIASYVHSKVAPGLGKIGVLVALESAGKADVLETLGTQIALHVAATNPASLSQADLDPALVERERAIFSEQALASGKPQNVVDKMIEGRIRKYYEEVCLLEQVSVHDQKTKIGKLVEDAAKDAGAPVSVAGFVRFQLGDGIEKEKSDFAAEVAAAAR
ncbi:translation elongation factor Ts [Zavarzinia sp. CC-PAN008]|uniref:translation elongation factor Ts n=1 Tax=Zavarzinia sp. CC-PAN008 TaxID=3243332 RepID=UPI003F742055